MMCLDQSFVRVQYPYDDVLIVSCMFVFSMQSSQLLFVLLGHLEEHSTHHIQSMLTGLYRGAQDGEQIVLDQVTHHHSNATRLPLQ